MRKIKSIFSKTMIASIVMLIIIAMTEMLSINKSVFASESGTVTADNVNFRQKASSSAEIIQSLKKGASLTVEGTEGDFYKVRYNSIEGYVSKQFVKVNTSASSEGESKNVDNNKDTENNNDSSNTNDNQNTNNAENIENNAQNDSESSNESNEILTEKEAIEKNKTKIKNETEIYVLPLLNSSKLGTIAKDEEVMLVSVSGKWAYIRGSKKSGWVNKEELESQTIYLPKNNTKKAEDTTNTSNQNSDDNNQENNQDNKANSDNNNSENGNSDTNNNDNNKGNENNQDSKSKNSNDSANGETETATETETNSKKTMYINVDAVNIRKEASTTATILNSAEKNSALEVLDTSNSEWYKVKTSSGTVGYVLAKYLSESME